MSWNNSIPRGNLPISREGSPLASPRESNSPAHLWKHSQAASSRAAAMTRLGVQVMNKINQAHRPNFGYAYSGYFPFQLYNFPRNMRQVVNNDDWRRLKVRFGYVDQGIPYGTDLDPSNAFTLSPTDETFIQTEIPPPSNASFVSGTWHEFIVPATDTYYWFWISMSLTAVGETFPVGIMVGTTNTDAYSLQSGNNHLNEAWPTFPNDDPYHFVIGKAKASAGILSVVQFLYNNLDFNRYIQPLPTVPRMRGAYDNSALYYVGDIVTVEDVSTGIPDMATHMPIPYMLYPPFGSSFGSENGPVTTIDPLSNSPDPWYQLSPTPQVYSGGQPNPTLALAPYDINKPAIYYQNGVANLWTWDPGSLTWTKII